MSSDVQVQVLSRAPQQYHPDQARGTETAVGPVPWRGHKTAIMELMSSQAADLAQRLVATVNDDPAGRRQLMLDLYQHPAAGMRKAPYRRSALAFMDWQLRRGLLNPPAAPSSGSPWWREVNSDLLRTSAEAGYLASGRPGTPSSQAVEFAIEFLTHPSPSHWYRAHNASIVDSYLAHRRLAEQEGRVERYFLNVVLMRVLYAHALVSAPRFALKWLGPAAPTLGNPSLGFTGIFLSLSRVLPAQYPLGEDVTPYVTGKHGFGQLLDAGIIQPRLRELYDWSAQELRIPELTALLVDDIPAYAWPANDWEDWILPSTIWSRSARRWLSVPR